MIFFCDVFLNQKFQEWLSLKVIVAVFDCENFIHYFLLRYSFNAAIFIVVSINYFAYGKLFDNSNDRIIAKFVFAAALYLTSHRSFCFT